ncbi:MAG: bifunctional phosphopantothenoylcysteine decarboxylase/phosphopantothenate--cysteine ligase CoaBC [Calditrichaeota bacterium]|nr:MAG: bifunctional phosphopantothenoylcysteine decarboxylase/phosphopantothenate--cysteine ligase CoaBC [Calditrichota bacterium]
MFPSNLFEKKHVLVGVTGCIAAYKSCELIRYLVTQHAEVRVMLTAGGEKFITPLTLETLSGHPVYREMFPEHQFTATHHIHLADWSDAAILAPATANIIGKLANGIADDFVSTTLLALHSPLVIAPAMNTHMWFNPAVQRNVRLLEKAGHLICSPEEGFLAEGYSGIGRLARLEYLIQYLYRALHPAPKSLEGKTVLITAGATREYFDPVRMITNPSTGKMGFALAWEAFARGAQVILIHGITELTPPVQVESYRVTSARDMYEQVQQCFPRADIFISAAAVADYRPKTVSTEKIKKKSSSFTIELEPTEDIIKEMAKQKQDHQKVVGFAMETSQARENALKKFASKQLDMIVLNDLTVRGAGFGVDTNRVTLFDSTREQELKLMSKLDVAREIFDFLLSQN